MRLKPRQKRSKHSRKPRMHCQTKADEAGAMNIREWNILFLFAVVFVCSMYPNGNSAAAPSAPLPARDQCQALSAQQLEDKARASAKVAQSSSKFTFLPGGAPATIEINAVPEKNSVYCGTFIENNRFV